MVTILCALVSIFEFRVRSRASLELELIALRHQVTVLRRQRKPPVRAAFRIALGRETACPLICKSMGTHDDGSEL
jgi:hypothetical protein